MSFAFASSLNTITQNEVDMTLPTSTGNGFAVSVVGGSNDASLNIVTTNSILTIYGTLTIDGEFNQLITTATPGYSGVVQVHSGGTLILGSRSLTNGYYSYSKASHLRTVKRSVNTYNFSAIRVFSGGTLIVYGGYFKVAGAIYFNAGSIIRLYQPTIEGLPGFTLRNFSTDIYTDKVLTRAIPLINYAEVSNPLSWSVDQVFEPNSLGRNSYGILSYGNSLGYGGTSPTTPQNFIDLKNTDLPSVFGIVDDPLVHIRNAESGVNTVTRSWLITENPPRRRNGIINFYKDIFFKVVDTVDIPLLGAKVTIPTANSTFLSLVANSEGIVDAVDKEFLLGTHTFSALPEGLPTITYNTVDGLAGDAFISTCELYGYLPINLDINVLGNGKLTVQGKMASNLAVEAALAQVQEYAFATIDGNTLTINENCTFQELHDYLEYYKYANPTVPTTRTRYASTFGNELRVALDITINAQISSSDKLSILQSSGTITISTDGSINGIYFDETFDTLVAIEMSSRFDTMSFHRTSDTSYSGESPLFTSNLIRFNLADHSGNIYYLTFSNSITGERSSRNKLTMPTLLGSYSYDFSFGESLQYATILTKLESLESLKQDTTNSIWVYPTIFPLSTASKISVFILEDLNTYSLQLRLENQETFTEYSLERRQRGFYISPLLTIDSEVLLEIQIYSDTTKIYSRIIPVANVSSSAYLTAYSSLAQGVT